MGTNPLTETPPRASSCDSPELAAARSLYERSELGRSEMSPEHDKWELSLLDAMGVLVRTIDELTDEASRFNNRLDGEKHSLWVACNELAKASSERDELRAKLAESDRVIEDLLARNDNTKIILEHTEAKLVEAEKTITVISINHGRTESELIAEKETAKVAEALQREVIEDLIAKLGEAGTEAANALEENARLQEYGEQQKGRADVAEARLLELTIERDEWIDRFNRVAEARGA